MKLTFRQKSFLRNLLDLCQEADKPLRYTEVARHLGLGKSSTYEMLRLLERKGLVISEYILPKENSSPGRSRIRFWPTAKAKEIHYTSTTDTEEEKDELEHFKAGVLDRVRHINISDRKNMLRESMRMMPDARWPLAMCAEALTSLLLRMDEVPHSLGTKTPLARLLGAPPTKLGMSLAAGLAAGSAQIDMASQRAVDQLYEQVKKFEVSIEKLSHEKLEDLRRYAQDVVDILQRT